MLQEVRSQKAKEAATAKKLMQFWYLKGQGLLQKVSKKIVYDICLEKYMCVSEDSKYFLKFSKYFSF